MQSIILTAVTVRDCGLLIVVRDTSFTFLKRKDALKRKIEVSRPGQIIKTRSPASTSTKAFCTKVWSTHIPRFSRSGFFRLARCPSPGHTWSHIEYQNSLCVCTHHSVYKHTPPLHPNTRKNREIYKENPTSLPLPKHSGPPRQLQAPDMDKLMKTPLPTQSPFYPRMQVLKNTCNTHACLGTREIREYKLAKCKNTSAYVNSVASMVASIYPSVNNNCHSLHICLCTPVYKTLVWCSGNFLPTHQHIHTHTRKHTWINDAAETAQGADADAGGSARLPRSTQSTTLSTSNARTQELHCTHFPTPIPPDSPPPLSCLFPINPKIARGPRATQFC